MPLDNNLLRKSESPLATTLHKKLPTLLIFNVAPSLESNEAILSCPFLMASNKGVLPKLSVQENAD